MTDLTKRIRPDDRFRRDAVYRAKSSTESVAVTAKTLGMGKSTLYRWIARYSDQPKICDPNKISAKTSKENVPTQKPSISTNEDEEREIEALRKEVQFLRDENEILRRAALAFARTIYPNPDRFKSSGSP